MGNPKNRDASIQGNLDAVRTPWTMIERARGGDAALRQEALGQLIDLYTKPVRAYIRALFPVFDDGRVEDAAQDLFQTWLQVASMLESARREKGFRPFLKHVLRCRARDAWVKESRRRHRSLTGPEGEAIEIADGAWERGEEALDRSAAMEYLDRAAGRVRAQLSHEKKEGEAGVFEALLGAALEGREPPKVRDLAKTLGISTGSVSTYRSNGVTQLVHALYALAGEVSEDPEEELAAVGLLAFLKRLKS